MTGRIFGLFLAAFAVRLVFVLAMPAMVRPDEIFQNMEPAHRLLTGYGVVTWEWRVGLRSWLLPELYRAIMRFGDLAGVGHTLGVVRVVLGAASLGLVWVAMIAGRQAAGPIGAAFCGTAIAFWPDCVLLGPRTLSEAQGGALVAAGVMLAGVACRESRAVRPGIPVMAGFLLALGVMIRVQYVPAVILCTLWCGITARRALLPLLAGAVPALAVAAWIDWHMAGLPFAPLWVDIRINYLQHRADTFGTQSTLFYPFVLLRAWGALAIVLVPGLVWGARRMTLELAAALVILASHSAIPHKEPSFVFAAIPLLVVVGAAGLAARWRDQHPSGDAIIRPCVIGACTCVLTLLASDRLDRAPGAPYLRAMHEARAMRDLCGIGQFAPSHGDWMQAGGYSILDRSVPMFFTENPAELAAMAPGINALIAPEDARRDIPAVFDNARCWRGICLLRRSGPCRSVAEGGINEELAREGG